MKDTAYRFAILHTMKFYGSANKHEIVLDECNAPMCFLTKQEAKRWIQSQNCVPYHLTHNQYSYDYSVLDLDKPTNQRRLNRALGLED